jgi:hypothetical protein
MGRSKYLYQSRAEYHEALKRADRKERATMWLAWGLRENRVVEFWIPWDGESYHFLACWSPRQITSVIAYVSKSGALEVHNEDDVREQANDSTSYVYPLWTQVLERSQELLMEQFHNPTREVFNAFVKNGAY